MLEQLIELDKELFITINSTWSNALFDTLLPPIRNMYFWIPVYLALCGFFIWKFKKQAILIIGLWIVTIFAGDRISSGIFKPFFERTRPYYEATIQEHIIKRVDQGPSFSFISSHATNHFAMSVFLSIVLWAKYRKRWITATLLFWAALVSYAQIYVGVHYPFDILAGLVVGTLIGIFTGWIYTYLLHHKIPANKANL